MKRVRAGIGLLVFLLLVILASSWLVRSTNTSLLAQLDQIERLCTAGDFAGAQEAIRRLNRFYAHREHWLALFIKRDYLGSTATCLGGLAAYAQPENLQDLKSEIGKAKAQIEMADHLFFSLL